MATAIGRIAITLLPMIPFAIGHAAELNSWQRMPDEPQLQRLATLPIVPISEIYEVVPTRVDTAFIWHLAKEPFAALTCADADFLAGGHFRCDQPKTPILVRAVYANGGTGNFTVRYDNRILYIHHGSMGDIAEPKNLPLIINLPSIPTGVFAWTSSAK